MSLRDRVQYDEWARHHKCQWPHVNCLREREPGSPYCAYHAEMERGLAEMAKGRPKMPRWALPPGWQLPVGRETDDERE